MKKFRDGLKQSMPLKFSAKYTQIVILRKCHPAIINELVQCHHNHAFQEIEPATRQRIRTELQIALLTSFVDRSRDYATTAELTR